MNPNSKPIAKMTPTTLKRLGKQYGFRNAFEMVALAASEGARLGRGENQQIKKAELWFVNRFNDQLTDVKERAQAAEERRIYLQKEKERQEREEAAKKRKKDNEKKKKARRRDELEEHRANMKAVQTGDLEEYRVDLEKWGYLKSPIKTLIIDSIPAGSTDWLVLEVGGQFFTLSRKFLSDLSEKILESIYEKEEGFGSDVQTAILIKNERYFTIRRFTPNSKTKRREGAFFPYLNLTEIDLEACQIFGFKSRVFLRDNCLVYALKQAQVPKEKIDRIRLRCKSSHVPFNSLESICQDLEMGITVYDGTHSRVFGKKYKEIIRLGHVKDHYFINEKTQYSSFSVKNYERVKHLPDWWEITREKEGKFYREKDRGMTNLQLIQLMLELNMFQEMGENDLADTQFSHAMEQTFDCLDYPPSAIEPVDIRDLWEDEDISELSDLMPLDTTVDETSKKKSKLIAFDFETDPNNTHVPYLCCSYDGEQVQTFYGEDCGKQLLESVPNDATLIAHNASYDYRFIVKYLTKIQELSRGNHLLSVSASFFKKRIKIRDSYNLITMPLKKFGKTFGLANEKEIMPYRIYTQQNIARVMVPIKEALIHVKKNDHSQFLKNIERWGLREGDRYDIIKYSAEYCALDVRVLYDGYNTFAGWIQEQLNIDISTTLTAASLAHKYFVNSGCYQGVNQLSSTPQAFIQECVVGGRCMAARNEKLYLKRDGTKYDATDANSLYPSAMARMGFLKGVPKVIQTFTPEKYDGYFIEIEITGIKTKLDFPLMSYRRQDGVRCFSNDMVGKKIKVDKTTLEDLIHFQGVSYKFIKGYYFDQGRNFKIQETINFLFNKRLELKKQHNPAQEVYKLVMNSGYGKSIMKPVQYNSHFFDDRETFESFWCRNHNYVHDGFQFGQAYKVRTIKALSEHFNICQVGVEILSMSKRIMNEVMCTAENIGCKMYYQDTDSIHMANADIEKLSDKYRAMYGRELIGKKLGQFSTDYEIKGCRDVTAIQSVILGKKCYLDVLQGVDEKTGHIKYDYHIRMKGIPNQVILNHCKKINNTPLELYRSMYFGKAVEFDLTDGSCCFEYKKDYTIATKTMFKRKMKF